MRVAEDANYFSTTVSPGASQGEISELLESFGAETIMVMTGKSAGKSALMIRFQWENKSYRFHFVPLDCRNPDKVISISGKRRTVAEQSRYQMGRIAVAFVKAILTAAEATPAALFGFVELPGTEVNGLPTTAGEMDLNEVKSFLSLPANIPTITIEGVIVDD